MNKLEDLGINNLKILQDTNGYKFTSDAVLLANFFDAKKSDRVVELCSGSGVISILASAKTNASEFHLFEIQTQLAILSQKSIDINNLDNFYVYNSDLKNAPKIMQGKRVDAVVVNPPYYTNESKSDNESIDIATHERTTSLAEIAEVAGKLLKFGGKFYMVHIVSRLAEICAELVKNNLEPKHIMFVKPTKEKAPTTLLVEAVKGAKPGLALSEIVYADLPENPREIIQNAKRKTN